MSEFWCDVCRVRILGGTWEGHKDAAEHRARLAEKQGLPREGLTLVPVYHVVRDNGALIFPGLVFGTGTNRLEIVGESEEYVAVRVPALSAWGRASGSMEYQPVRYDVYRLDKSDADSLRAIHVLTFTPRTKPNKRARPRLKTQSERGTSPRRDRSA
jgi:hypothetical protein